MTAASLRDAGERSGSTDEFRLAYIAVLAGVIGVGAGIVAFLVYHFIGFLYNLFFYQRLSFAFITPPDGGLAEWVWRLEGIAATAGVADGKRRRPGTVPGRGDV